MSKINTKTQDADTCILCGKDTSKTQGYCKSCEKKLRGKK